MTRREALRAHLSGRFWLRFHASLIVAGTFASGFLASFVLLRLGLDAVLPRWLAAVAIGYAAFFVLVRFWLAYVGVHRLDVESGAGDASVDSGGFDLRLPEPAWRASGGQFGGGGATGDFSRSLPMAKLSGTASPSASSGTGDAVGSVLGGVDDALPIVLGLIVLALVAALLGSAIAFVWMAPELLTDAAFAALLSGGALRGLAKAEAGDWHATLFAATWKPLTAVIVVTAGAAWALGHWFPGARSLGEAWRMLV